MFYLPQPFDDIVCPLIENDFTSSFAFTSVYLWYLPITRLLSVIIRLLDNINAKDMEQVYMMCKMIGPLIPKFSRKHDLMDDVCNRRKGVKVFV